MDCDYCSNSFENDKKYTKHLKNQHEGELSRVDKKKVEQVLEGGSSSSSFVNPYAVGATVLSIAIVGLVVFIAVGNPLGTDNSVEGTQDPGPVGGAHIHGPLDMTVLGNEVDFSQPQYQLQADAFHFEGGRGDRWHGHAEGVTLKWGMNSLGIDVTPDSVTYEGTTYNDSDPEYNVSVTVDGQSVNPSSYVLQRDDAISVIVEESNQS